MAGVIGLRGPDIEKRGALRGHRVLFVDADRPFVRPHTGLPVLTMQDGAPDVHRHVFGFTKKFASFNARFERLLESPMWGRMYLHDGHHGIAPVSYILEWGDLGDGKGKCPWRIERKDGAAMCVPALVGHHWEQKDSDAFALVTIAPNAFVAKFHDRMIGQLRDEDVPVWLAPEEHGRARVEECLAAPADDELIAYPLRADAGKARFDDPAALEAVGPPVAWDDVHHTGRNAQQKLF